MTSSTPASAPANRPPASGFAQFATLTAALLGWMFDGFEMGLFPVIGKPALKDLLGATVTPGEVDQWFGVIMAVFLVGAASGGVLFGWLGDKIGRVRAMSLSIVTYAVLTGMCGFATQAWQIAVLRFIASLGMGGEWSLGVALVN
jgi:MFS family permease